MSHYSRRHRETSGKRAKRLADYRRHVRKRELPKKAIGNGVRKISRSNWDRERKGV